MSAGTRLYAEKPSETAETFQGHALLVGCTKYPNNAKIPELWGPANDIPAFADMLQTRFHFPKANIQRLVGWPEDPKLRPTHANIAAAFEKLIQTARPNSQIVILMSGHGTQTPIPESQQLALDPANPEHDGMDEVFLPADFAGWNQTGLENAILDDQMGRWLEQLKKRGAFVWIVFDCCHSGTMTKAADFVERQRGVKPQAIGVPDHAIKSAMRKAKSSGERSRGILAGEVDVLDLSSQTAKAGPGGVAAFYAAQAFETAPELPRPADAPRTREHYFGLLTYILIQSLESQGHSMTYRDLGRHVIGRYRAERGSKSPTPFFSGDLDREVLGLSVFPERSSLRLERMDRTMRLSAGEFLGITKGSILGVFPPTDRTRQDEARLGYVRVTKASPTFSEVESCAHQGKPAVPLANFPEFAKCEIAWQELGDLRLKLAVASSNSLPAKTLVPNLHAAIKALPAEIGTLIRQVDDAADADWVLRVLEPKDALSQYGMRIDHPTAFLVKTHLPGDSQDPGNSLPRVAMRRVFGQYPIEDPASLARRLELDLQKLFTWQNTWRVAGMASGEQSRGAKHNLQLEVSRVENAKTVKSQESPGQTFFVPGDDLRVRIVNKGTKEFWVTLLYLDANFGITVWFSEALQPGGSFVDGGTVDGSSSGPEGFIVLAIPVQTQKSQPAYEFLEQDGLGIATRELKSPPKRPMNPFEQLMSAAAFGKGTHRGLRRNASSTPQILSWSWVTLPASKEK